MSDRLDQCKEVVEEGTVVEFLEASLGMGEDNVGQMGNNLEEAWVNLEEEYFIGDSVPALQVNCPIPKSFRTDMRHHHHHQTLFLSKSRGQARKSEGNSHENSRDQEFSGEFRI